MEFRRVSIAASILLLLVLHATVTAERFEREEMNDGEEGDDEEGDEDNYDDEGEGDENEEMFEIPPIPEEACQLPDGAKINDFARHITYQAPLTHDGKLIVLDRVFDSQQLDIFLGLFQSAYTSWVFTGFDPTENETSALAPANHAPWTAMIPAVEFSSTELWRHIQHIVEGVFPGTGEVKLATVILHVLRWGDQLKPDLGRQDDKSIVAQIYLENWRRNYYGETLLFNDSTSVAGGIHPRRGRMALFSASSKRLLHPPAIDYPAAQHLIELRMARSNADSSSDDFDKPFQQNQEFLQEIERRGPVMQGMFFAKGIAKDKGRTEERNVGDYLVKSYTAKSGDRLAVFDNYLDKADVKKLHQLVMHGTLYHYDLSESAVENAKWATEFSVPLFRSSRLHDQLQQLVNQFTGSDTYHPYHVGPSLVRAADHTRMHQDCQEPDHDVTVTVYLNPEWTQNMLGETMFFEPGPGGETESSVAVRPRYGRVAVFHGLFRNSARPPSPVFQGARYTFSVKYAETKEKAQKKESQTEGSVAQYDELLKTGRIRYLIDDLRNQMADVDEFDVGKRIILDKIQDLENRVGTEKITGADIKAIIDIVENKVKETVPFHDI